MSASVRWRLTLAVIAVVGALAVIAALLAPRMVEQALVDDRLEAEIPVERASLGDELATVVISGGELTSPELTAIFGPDIADLASSLDAVGALDELRSFSDDGTVLVAAAPGVIGAIESDGRVRVDRVPPQLVDGPVVTGSRLQSLATALSPTSVFDTSPFDVVLGDLSIDEFVADLDERFGDRILERLDLGGLDVGRLGGDFLPEEFLRDLEAIQVDELPLPLRPVEPVVSVDQLVFGTREVAGTDVIVAASSDGIDITVDRVRGALWAGVPAAMLLTGLVTWLLAGRALRPVRAITEQTGRIRAGTLHERVPVPRSNDEVAGLATEMNDMLDRIGREDRRRRQFVADASHELRSPIASIHTQAEVAISEDGDASTVALATGVLAEATRLGTIVDDLLALARHDEALAPPGSIVDLDDVVLAAASRPRRVHVDTSGVSAGRVRGHVDELSRSVAHLLDNASRHATDVVRVSLTSDADHVVLTVDDDGPGVDPDARERIFERFVRLDEARVRDDGGAGLGLAVVATVVSSAGGDVGVTESDLGGARFVVTLPASS